jgi:hypothetical protein
MILMDMMINRTIGHTLLHCMFLSYEDYLSDVYGGKIGRLKPKVEVDL